MKYYLIKLVLSINKYCNAWPWGTHAP